MNTKNAALFCVGFNLLQPIQICLAGASFAMQRFGIPKEGATLFINMSHNTMELGGLTGNVLAAIAMAHWERLPGMLSMILSWLISLSNCLLLLFYSTGVGSVNLTKYYWLMVISAFFFSAQTNTVLKVEPQDLIYFTIGFPITNVFVIGYQAFFKFYIARYVNDADYWIVVWHIIIVCLISLVTAILWTSYLIRSGKVRIWFGENKRVHTEGDKMIKEVMGSCHCLHLTRYNALMNGISPILMNIVAHSTIYAFYPAIIPFKLAPFDVCNNIQLLAMFCEIIPAFAFLICQIKDLGINKRWVGQYWLWHLAWLMEIPYASIPLTIFHIFHYPKSGLTAVLKNSYVIGVMTCLFMFSYSGLKMAGISGGFANALGDARDTCQQGSKCSCKEGGLMGNTCIIYEKAKKIAGDATLIGMCTALVIMNFLAFMGGGYVKVYDRHVKALGYDSFGDGSRDEVWPTNGMGTLGSIWFWVSRSLAESWKSIKNSFTLDVPAAIIPMGAGREDADTQLYVTSLM